MPPDVPLCIELTYESGRCVKVISGQEFNWNEVERYKQKTWWEYRQQMILMPSDSWKELKKYIIQTCKKYNNCQSEIGSWDNLEKLGDF